MLSCLRTITAGLIVWALLVSPAVAETRPLADPKIAVAFDQELFELAYTIFLANSNLTEALAVTELALQAKPSDKVWRRRGAQTAEWAGRPELALTHWFFLAQQGDKIAAQAALRISRSLNELLMRRQLLERITLESTDLELHKEYLAIIEKMGLPEEAYTMLTSGKIRTPDKVWQFTEQARLAEVLGRPDETFAAWEKRAALKPLSTDESLRVASLWYGQGNVEQSFRALQKSSSATPYNSTIFWRTYSDLAWTLQRIPEAIKGSLSLIRTGDATEADYQRIQLTFQVSDPELAYPIIRKGWQRFNKPDFWYAMVETGLKIGRGRELATFYKNMTQEEQRVLSRDGRSWYSLALVHRQNGDVEASLMAARMAVQLEKNNVDLISGYLWLLVDLKQLEELRSLIMEVQTLAATTTELREPLAAAMMLLGEPVRALSLYRMLARSRHDDPAWLVSYGDVLEQAGHPEAAWQVRRHAQKLIARRINSGSETSNSNRNDLLIQAQLMMLLSPGDGLSRLIQRIAADGTNDSGRELVMAWAMSGGQTDLARLWYWRNFALAVERPDWALFGLALEENDQAGIADLIDKKLERLPYREAIEGARRTGMIPTAETLAFEKIQQNDQDYLLDRQLRDLYEPNSSKLLYSVAVLDRGGVDILDQQVVAKLFLDNRTYLNAELGTTGFRHQKAGVVGIYESSRQKGVLGLGYRYAEGNVNINAGVIDGLYRHLTWQLLGNRRFTSRLTVDAGIEIGSETNESVPLLIGGMKDEMALGLNYRMTERDNLRLRGATFLYLDQMRRYLGGGSSMNTELVHRINVAWPDYTLRFFGGYHQYHANGTPVEKTWLLIPRDVPKNAAYFIPASFGQIGAGIALGQTSKETYSRDWKLFAAVDTLWNSVSGAGFMYEAGVVGPLLGFDALLISVSQESGALGSSDVSTRFDLKYRYLFN